MSKKFYSIANFISNCISRFFLGKTMNNDENINDIESPHFIIERVIDENIRLGIGSLYKNGEGTEILKFNDKYLELIDTEFTENELQFHFVNVNKNLNYKLIVTKHKKLIQSNKRNLLEYKLINLQAMYYDVIAAGTIHKITMKPIRMDISKNIDEIALLFQ
jgi:hypothetical protein